MDNLLSDISRSQICTENNLSGATKTSFIWWSQLETWLILGLHFLKENIQLKDSPLLIQLLVEGEIG